MLRVFAFALCALVSAPAQTPATRGKPAPQPTPPPTYEQRPAIYPLKTCLISGEELGADAVTFTVDGTTFRTCCAKCQAKVEKDPASFKAKLDEATIAAQLPTYALKECLVSGEPLGQMGDPVKLVLDGTLVQLCCKRCVNKATGHAAVVAKRVRDAACTAQLKTYPLTTCVVGGDPLGDDAVNVMVGTTLVRLCCKKCLAEFDKDPAKYVAKVSAKPAAGETGKEPAPAAAPGEAPAKKGGDDSPR